MTENKRNDHSLRNIMKNRFIVPVLAMILVLSAAVPAALAYFTDYEDAKGSATLHLNGEIQLKETVLDNNKHVVISNVGETDMITRVLVIGDEEIINIDAGSGWKQENDGYWYYEQILEPENDSTELFVEVKASGKEEEVAAHNFDIIVVQESERTTYTNQGNTNVLDTPDGWLWPNGAVTSEVSGQ